MRTSESLLDALPLLENRVYRFYRGGALLDAFRGATDPSDSDRPEDWIASVTSAISPSWRTAPAEGLSRVVVGAQERLLAELVLQDPVAMLGRELAAQLRGTTGLLVKLLDAAVRLPVHCHPSRDFARRVLGSPFGKAEAWIVLDTRAMPGQEAPCIRLGFRHEVPAARLRDWIESQDREALLSAMHLLPASPGDVYFVAPGMPHAIGAGVFLLELQEPTDFSVVAEYSGFPMAPSDAHMGYGWDAMLSCFDRRAVTAEELSERLVQRPEVLRDDAEFREVRLLGRVTAPYFRATRLTVRETMNLPYQDTLLICVVTAGRGELHGATSGLAVKRGDTCLVPAAASAAITVTVVEPIELIVCRPPEPSALRSTMLSGAE